MARLFLGLVAVVIGIATYIGIDCYVVGIAEQMTDIMYRNEGTDSSFSSSTNCAAQYYYQKQIDNNCTFNVHLVQMGKLLASFMNHSEILQLSDMVEEDLIQSALNFNSKGSNSSQQRRELFRSYFDDFYTKTETQQICTEHNEAVDFFQFIQNGSNRTSNASQTAVNYYDYLPINDVLNNNQFVSQSKHKSDHINDSYFPPKLYSYTLSVDSTGYLPSLELRFAEICNEYQHHDIKHVTLNRNQKHLLWAGEMFYFYDYKYRQYVLVIDDASGHWKPDATKIPKYLELFFYLALFSDYNPSRLFSQRQDIYEYTNFYRPLMFVGHDDYPWHDLKRVMFPVVGRISAMQTAKHREKKAKEMLEKMSANASNVSLVEKLTNFRHRKRKQFASFGAF